MGKIILTGDRPTGRLHIGHYVGSLRRRVELQNSGEYEKIFIMIADAQALTDNADNPDKIRENIIEVALDYMSAGLDPEKSVLFIQSQISELTELTFYYMNLVTVQRLQRNPTVKQEIQFRGYSDNAEEADNKAGIPVGFFCYPISQASDITAFKANIVPVGEDQIPMIEQAREIVRKFNSTYGETLVEPQALLPDNSACMRLPGTDGKSKMSKSLGNCIYLADSAEEVWEKVRLMITDPARIHKTDPGHPEICLVHTYQEIFNREGIEETRSSCRGGRIGCVACKKRLAEKINNVLEPVRERRAVWEARPRIVDEISASGADRARTAAAHTMEMVRAAMGV